MALNTLDWVSNVLDNEKSQQLLTGFAEKLINGPLKNKGDYAQEKALKVFSEGINYYESLLQYKEGVHHSQLKPVNFMLKKDQYFNSINYIQSTINAAIERQYNLFVLLFNQPADINAIDIELPILKNEQSQKLLGEYQERLTDYCLNGKGDDVKKAGLLLFSEGICHLENELLQKIASSDSMDYRKKIYKEASKTQQTIEIELKRQFRHFTIFM